MAIGKSKIRQRLVKPPTVKPLVVGSDVDRLIHTRECAALIGCHTATLWRMCKSGVFPQPLILGPKSRAWPASVIRTWIESRQRRAA